MRNAKPVITLERERERERESYTLEDKEVAIVLACNKNSKLKANRAY